MIDVLLPVLDRPQRVAHLVQALANTTDVDYRLVFLCSKGDEEEIAAVTEMGTEYLLLDAPPAQGQYAKKINLGFRSTDSEWLFLAADDIAPQPGWASAALKTASEQISVISINDRANAFVRQGLLATHSLIRRSYIEEYGASLDGPGIIYHQGYDHNFVDAELSVLARDRGVFVFARDSIVEHLHPTFGKGAMDATYEKGLREFSSDRSLFCERMSEYRNDPLMRRFMQAEQHFTRRSRGRRRRM